MQLHLADELPGNLRKDKQKCKIGFTLNPKCCPIVVHGEMSKQSAAMQHILSKQHKLIAEISAQWT